MYQAVLRAFTASGRPPSPGELEETAPRHGIMAGQALATLAAADVLGAGKNVSPGANERDQERWAAGCR